MDVDYQHVRQDNLRHLQAAFGVVGNQHIVLGRDESRSNLVAAVGLHVDNEGLLKLWLRMREDLGARRDLFGKPGRRHWSGIAPGFLSQRDRKEERRALANFALKP